MKAAVSKQNEVTTSGGLVSLGGILTAAIAGVSGNYFMFYIGIAAVAIGTALITDVWYPFISFGCPRAILLMGSS